jgi:hypothetical protein
MANTRCEIPKEHPSIALLPHPARLALPAHINIARVPLPAFRTNPNGPIILCWLQLDSTAHVLSVVGIRPRATFHSSNASGSVSADYRPAPSAIIAPPRPPGHPYLQNARDQRLHPSPVLGVLLREGLHHQPLQLMHSILRNVESRRPHTHVDVAGVGEIPGLKLYRRYGVLVRLAPGRLVSS